MNYGRWINDLHRLIKDINSFHNLYHNMMNCTMIYTMNFTMNYDIALFSLRFNGQNIWFGRGAESLRASYKPNLISTNERADNIRPMRS